MASSVKQINASAEATAGKQIVAPIQSNTLSSLSKAGLSIKTLAAGFAAAQLAVQGAMAVLQQISGSVSSLVQVNSQMEQLRLQFEVMIGDKDKMEELFAITKKFADTTPFNDLESYRAGQQLLAANVKEAQDYEKALRTVGDLAAASGRPISEAAGAYARLRSGASGEAMEALRQMNISRQAFQMEGINFDSGGQALATSTELTAALDRIVSSRYGGTTQKLAASWEGLWSTFESSAQNAIRSLTGGAFEVLKTSISDVTKSLDDMVKDPDKKLEKLGEAIKSAAKTVEELKNAIAPGGGGTFMSLLSKGIKGAADGVSFFTQAMTLAAASVQFFWDTLQGNDARGNFAKTMQAAGKDMGERVKSWRKIWNTQDDSSTNAPKTAEEQAKARQKAQDDAQAKASTNRDAVVSDLKKIMAVQESAWTVEKARGRDSVMLAKAELEQREYNLRVTQEQEAIRDQFLDAKNVKHTKSAELLDAEAAAAKALAAYYDALIEKKEKMGEFVTQTAKLLAEADAIDKRGGDSGVKKYEALKSAAEEYLDTLKKMRDAQQQTTSNVAQMKAATDAAKAGNLAQYQTVMNVVEQGEQIFAIKSLQERLSQIQQLSQAQNLGARERFSLYEQERQVFAELTGSIGKAIADTMGKIEALQGKALSSASGAVGALGKIGADKSYYQEVYSAIRGMNMDKSKMSLGNMSQIIDLATDLKNKAGIDARDIMPSAGDIVAAFKREIPGMNDTISKLQTGMKSLIDISTQVGKQASDNFWRPWEAKFSTIKQMFESLKNINLNPQSGILPTGALPPNSQTAENKTVNVTNATTLNLQGVSPKEIDSIVKTATDKFSEDLYRALQEANVQYGL